MVLAAAVPPVEAGPRRTQQTASFERGRRDLPKLALTFDGGGDAGESARILDVLRERGVTATIFLTGDYINRNPELVRRILAEGHEVGNHTWSHPHLTTWDRTRRHDTLPGLDAAFVRSELNRTAAAFEAATGRFMVPLWRAPYGEVNEELLRWAAAAGWSHVGWTRDDRGGRHTLDSLDWVAERTARTYLTSRQISARILSFGAGGAGLNGGVVLMHLSTNREDRQVTRLGELVDRLREDGYSLVPVTELLADLPAPPAPAALAAAARDR
jgi:peptidoglycan/xylan/chitin deacetylase (PgdA/CDA1 family)